MVLRTQFIHQWIVSIFGGPHVLGQDFKAVTKQPGPSGRNIKINFFFLPSSEALKSENFYNVGLILV